MQHAASLLVCCSAMEQRIVFSCCVFGDKQPEFVAFKGVDICKFMVKCIETAVADSRSPDLA